MTTVSAGRPSAYEVVHAALGKRATKPLTDAVIAALDKAGMLNPNPGEPLVIDLEPDRTVTHVTELAPGVELSWCGTVLVSIEVRR
jgi:hypothetical protein